MKRALLGGLAVVLVALFAWPFITRAVLAERLVEEANAVCAPRARPTHRGTRDGGTFDACVGALADAEPERAKRIGRSLVEAMVVRTMLARGEARYETLDAGARELIDDAVPWARAVARCTDAPETLGDATGGCLASFRDAQEQARGATIASVHFLLVEAVRASQRGAANEAVDLCSDALAVGRDIAIQHGLVGAMIFNASVRSAVSVCGPVLVIAAPDDRNRFIDSLGPLRVGIPDFERVLVHERAAIQLTVFGDRLDADERARLPVQARAPDLVVEGYEAQAGVRWALAWPTVRARGFAMIEANRAPDRLAALDAAAEVSKFDQLVVGIQPGSSFSDFARRHRATGRGLDLLESVVRVKSGKPPLPEVTQAPIDGGTELTIDWFNGERLSVRLPPTP